MIKSLRTVAMAALALFVGTSANAGNVVDELTNATIGVSGNTYQETTGITVSSDAVYSAQSAGGNNAIQLRSNNSNSGIVTTASGGKLVSVTIAFNSNTNAQRVVSIYGKNEAYSAPSDLYGEATQGDLLGEVGMSDENMTVTVEGDYTFFGLRSKSGALYIDKITVTWETEGASKTQTTTTINATGLTNTDLANGTAAGKLTATVIAGETTVADAAIAWSSSNEAVATIAEDGTVTLVATGTTTLKAAYAGNDTYTASNATYELVVSNSAATAITLAEAQAAAKDAIVIVEGTVVASAANGAVLADGTDYLYYYNTANALEVGQKVRMEGAISVYGGANQLTASATITELGTETVTHPEAVELKGTDFDAIVAAKVAERKFVTFTGSLAISGNYYNITIEGAENAVGSIVKPKEDLSSLNGKEVIVTGYLMYVNNKYVYAVATKVEAANADDRQDAGLAWSATAYTATIGSEDNVFPTLTNPNNLTVTYSSSDETVATIDAQGAITLIAAGETTIKAAFAGNDEFTDDEATYTLTVKEAQEPINGIVSTFLDKDLNVAEGELTWAASIAANGFESSGSARGVQFGAAKGWFNLWGLYEVNNVTKVVLTVSTNANSDQNTISLKVGDAVFTADGEATYKMPKDNNYDVTFVGEGSGTIVITVNDAAKSVYFKSIAIEGEMTDVATAIETVKTAAQQGAVYNMAGQRVAEGFRGLIIKDGKKMFVK